MSDKTEVKKLVKDRYDLQGWVKTRGNLFRDAERFEDLRPVVSSYREKCHLRVNRYLVKEGRYLLDVASGPVQYPEYLSYTEGYKHRICGDISFTALQEARKVIRPNDFCVQCDITRLPFSKDVVDGVVSLHTIYHVPADEQAKAFQELYRVLHPKKNAVVVYSIGRYSKILKILGLPIRISKPIQRIIMALNRRIKRLLGTFKKKPEIWGEKLYFFAHPYPWLEKTLASFCDFDIFTWRSVPVSVTRFYIHRFLFGKALLAVLYKLEDWFPRWFGRYWTYPIIVMRK